LEYFRYEAGICGYIERLSPSKEDSPRTEELSPWQQ